MDIRYIIARTLSQLPMHKFAAYLSIWGSESRQNAELLHGEFLRLRLMIMALLKDQASLFPTSEQRLSTMASAHFA